MHLLWQKGLDTMQTASLHLYHEQNKNNIETQRAKSSISQVSFFLTNGSASGSAY